MMEVTAPAAVAASTPESDRSRRGVLLGADDLPTNEDAAEIDSKHSITSATTTTTATAHEKQPPSSSIAADPERTMQKEEEGMSGNVVPNVDDEVSGRPTLNGAVAVGSSAKQVQFQPSDIESSSSSSASSSSSSSPLRKESSESVPSVVSALTETDPDVTTTTPLLEMEQVGNHEDADDSNKERDSPTRTIHPPPSYDQWVAALSSSSTNGVGTTNSTAVDALHARACRLAKGNRAASAHLLVASANLFDSAAKALQVAALGAVPTTTSSPQQQHQTSHKAMNVKLVMGELQEWAAHCGRQYGTLASTLKLNSQPLPSYGAVQIDALAGMEQRFRHAQHACRDEGRRSTDETSPAAPETPRSSITSVLRDNEAPPSPLVGDQLTRLEQMVLEQLLLLETDRVKIFGPIVHKALVAVHECLDGMTVPTFHQAMSVVTRQASVDDEEYGIDNDASASSDAGDGISLGGAPTSSPTMDNNGGASEARRVKKKLFGNKRGGGGGGGGGGGVMDAETLGLPEDVGRLRDDVKAKIAARSNRLLVIRALAGFLENVAAAWAKLGGGLRQLLDEVQPPQNTSTAAASRNAFNIATSLPWSPSSAVSMTEAMKDESPALRTLWNDITAVLERESKAALVLASSLRALRSDKLDRAILYGDKTIKAATDLDDALWKQLCDSARHQSKTETRYRQVSAQTAKMRERVKSQDSDPGSKAGLLLKNMKEPSKVNKHVSKSIANMFSILPDGGAEALKMFAPGARATIAAHSLEEADTRESNRRQQLDAAVEATAKCLESYKSTANSLVKQYDDDEAVALEDIRCVVSGVASAVESGLQSRRSSVAAIDPWSGDFTYLEDVKTGLRARLESTWTQSTAGDAALTLKGEVGTPVARTADATNSAGESSDVNSTAGASFSSRSDDAGSGSPAQNFSFDTDDGDDDGGWKQQDTSSPQKSVTTSGSEVLRRSSSGLDASPNRSTPTGMLSIETEVFLSAFWQDAVDRSKVSQVKESYACSFRESSHRLPTLYGRLFVTSSRIIFNSWTGRKLNVAWPDIKSIECVASADEDSLLLTCRKSEIEDMYSILGGFENRSLILESINSLRRGASRSVIEAASAANAPPSMPSLEPVLSVPPDATLKKMSLVLSRRLKGISVQRFYEVAWSEEDKPFYKQWLSRVCFDISMGAWQFEPAVGPWCGESYDQKRTVTFKVKRRTHLYIGPPIANVKQTHYCRREGNDKCVLGMTVEFEGMPYCDTFRVEVRWVARREGESDIQVDVGVVVDFQKSTLLKSKIQAGTIEETTPVQRNLFEAIKAACVAASGQVVETVNEEDEAPMAPDVVDVKELSTIAATSASQTRTLLVGLASVVLYLLWRILVRWAKSSSTTPVLTESHDLQHLSRRMDDLEVEIKLVQSTLSEMLELLKAQRQDSQ